MIATPWPTETTLLVLLALVVILAAVAFASNRFAKMVLRETPSQPSTAEERQERRLRLIVSADRKQVL